MHSMSVKSNSLDKSLKLLKSHEIMFFVLLVGILALLSFVLQKVILYTCLSALEEYLTLSLLEFFSELTYGQLSMHRGLKDSPPWKLILNCHILK